MERIFHDMLGIIRKTKYFLTGGDFVLKQLESFRKMLIERNETMICKCGIGLEGHSHGVWVLKRVT